MERVWILARGVSGCSIQAKRHHDESGRTICGRQGDVKVRSPERSGSESASSFRFLGPEDSQKVLVDLWGNPKGDAPLGMLIPADKEPDPLRGSPQRDEGRHNRGERGERSSSSSPSSPRGPGSSGFSGPRPPPSRVPAPLCSTPNMEGVRGGLQSPRSSGPTRPHRRVFGRAHPAVVFEPL